jgi:hypothetical protein
MIRGAVLSLLPSLVSTLLVLVVLGVTEAQVMQSASYQIQSDSLNIGGGNSTSTNYILESTAGEVATGPSDSETYSVNAGFQQMNSLYIALSGATNVVMDDTISGVTGGAANGSTTVTVITDSPGGYALTISSENDPAMQKGGDTIADYDPVGSDPGFDFTYDSGEAWFGFSPEGVDITSQFKDDGGSTCGGGGSLDTHLKCWEGLSTGGQTIAQGISSNHPTGATTTVYFQVGIGDGVNQAPGFYVATTTITALAL